MSATIPARSRFNQRLEGLFRAAIAQSKTDGVSSLEVQAHWAKYLCILTSGYLEQSFKEIILEYAFRRSSKEVRDGLEKLWPPVNMWADNVILIMGHFNDDWKKKIEEYINSAVKHEINSLISWRNNIAHGNDANTNGVTLPSVQEKFKAVNKLLDEVDKIVKNK